MQESTVAGERAVDVESTEAWERAGLQESTVAGERAVLDEGTDVYVRAMPQQVTRPPCRNCGHSFKGHYVDGTCGRCGSLGPCGRNTSYPRRGKYAPAHEFGGSNVIDVEEDEA